jgi:hypothetical protein
MRRYFKKTLKCPNYVLDYYLHKFKIADRKKQLRKYPLLLYIAEHGSDGGIEQIFTEKFKISERDFVNALKKKYQRRCKLE